MTTKKRAKPKAPAHIGRPRVGNDDGPSVVIRARVGSARAEKFHALGGPAWLREQIDRARIPPKPYDPDAPPKDDIEPPAPPPAVYVPPETVRAAMIDSSRRGAT